MLPIEKFPSLVLSKNAIMSKLFNICQVVTINGRLKPTQNFKRLALKVVTVAYERLSLYLTNKEA